MRSLSVILALCACGPKKPAPPPVFDEAADFDEASLNAMVADLVPLVEEAAGRPFAAIPHARLARLSDVETILEAEFLEVAGDLYDAPDWVLRGMAADARASAPGIVGKYGVQTRVLYLAPEAVVAVAAGTGLPAEATGDVARLVLAHEMAHALQAEASPWDDLVDGDHFDAVRAVTEGHANFVEQAVADRLGLDAERRGLDAGQGWDERGPSSPAAFETWALYGQGKAFVAHHFALGGTGRAWEVVAEPPSATSMIFRPDTYDPIVRRGEDFSGALDGVEGLLTEGAWVTIGGRAGEMSLREELFGKDAAEVDAVLGALVGGTVRDAFRTDRRATLRAMRFADAASARRMVALATAPTPLPEGLDPAVWSDVATPYDGVEADLAVQRVVGPKDMGVDHEVTEVWVARGDLVVQVRAAAFRPGIRLREAVAAVLERLPG